MNRSNTETLCRHFKQAGWNYVTDAEGNFKTGCSLGEDGCLEVEYDVDREAFSVVVKHSLQFRGRKYFRALVQTLNTVAANPAMPKMLMLGDSALFATHYYEVELSDRAIARAMSRTARAARAVSKLVPKVLETGKPADLEDLWGVIREEQEAEESSTSEGATPPSGRSQFLSALAGEMRDRAEDES